MAHKFQKGVADYALGMVSMVLSRIADHQGAHNGAKPRMIILHKAGYEAFMKEMKEKFGGAEAVEIPGQTLKGPGVFGVLICFCPGEGHEPIDYYIDVNGDKQNL